MYSVFRHWCERLLRIPPEPRPPPGDEASTRIYRAAPNFFKYLLVVWALASFGIFMIIAICMVGPAAGSIALLQKGKEGGWFLMLIPAVAFAIFAFFRLFRLAVLRIDYEKRWYIVTDRSLRVREGVVRVQEMTVTFANIQNITISQGPIQRLLGIADLRVDTAGGGSGGNAKHGQAGPNLHTAWFRGVDNAPEVREVIQQRLRQWRDAGLGDHEDLANAHPAPSADILAALREVCAEARGLRETIGRAG